MARTVIVSNRIPVPNARGPQAGGLAIVLKDAVKPGDLWFGWSGKTAEESSTKPNITETDGVQYATLDLSESDYEKFYVGFANSTLWPLLHFRLGLMEFRREHFDGYRAVNQFFANALAKLLKPDDIIWVHDYHLMPLAAQLRELGVTARMGFYLHIPFVPASVFRSLPQGSGLLEDLCAYDVLGFQTDQHHRDFLDCVRQILHIETDADGTIHAPNRTVRSLVDPVGIDCNAFRKLAEKNVKLRNTQRLKASLNQSKLMIGVDRLDYSKGLPDRFEAFNRLLTRFPEHKQKISFLQIAAPSRQEVVQYAALRPVLNRMAGDINGRHGAFDWVPLRYMSQGVLRSTLAGFYRLANIGVVTPLRDGMNLVAHEYIASQDPEDPGVLILSQFAGAARYFEDALIANPHDPDEIAEAMHEAMKMSLEKRKKRHERLYESLKSLTTRAYCDTFMNALQEDAE